MTNSSSAKSTYAYSPGLKVKRNELVRKRRILSVPGEVLVKEGDSVSFDTVVAKASLRGLPHISRTASILGVDPDELEYYMLKKTGDFVKEGEIIAEVSGFFGLFSRKCASPTTGTIESISNLTGQVIIRELDIELELKAYIPGKVVKVFPNEGVEVATNAAFIQGIFGVGSETHGELKICAESNKDILTENDINSDFKGKILVGGAKISKGALYKAIEIGAAGIIAGGIEDNILMDFLGYEIGVAITGQEDIPLTIIVTEGFGEMAMSKNSFTLLENFEGYTVSATGETQIRAGVMRPEIIIPHEYDGDKKIEENMEHSLVEGMGIGTLVRVIREPYFGAIGKITMLPVQLQNIRSESMVRVMEIEIEDGKRVIVPRTNVEIIEE